MLSLRAEHPRKMDTGDDSHGSTSAADDRWQARAAGTASGGFALGRVESFGKSSQVYRSSRTPRSSGTSTAALQSSWVQRLNLFTPASDAEEELTGRKPPGKDIHVWTHFAKDFSSCRRPDATSHSRSSSWPPDGLTVNEVDLCGNKLAAPAAGPCDSGTPPNHMSREKSSMLKDGNLLVPSGEATQCCGADFRTENLGSGGEKRSDNKSYSPLEVLVPCLKKDGTPHRTNWMSERGDGEHKCKVDNLATRHFGQTSGDRQISLLNSATGVCFSRPDSREHLLSSFRSESIAASLASSRSDCHWGSPCDIDAKEKVLSTFASASKVGSRGASADADRRLLVSPADMKKDKVIGRPKGAATHAFSTVDAQRQDPVSSPVELDYTTVLCSGASQTTGAKYIRGCTETSNREIAGKDVEMRSEAEDDINLMEHAMDTDKRLAKTQFLSNGPFGEKVWHDLGKRAEENYGIDSKALVGDARPPLTERYDAVRRFNDTSRAEPKKIYDENYFFRERESTKIMPFECISIASASGDDLARPCIPKTSTEERWSNWIHDYQDSKYLKPEEPFSSTASLPQDYFLEEYCGSYLKGAANSLTNDTAEKRNEWMSGLHTPVKAGVGIRSSCDSPQRLSSSWLQDDSLSLKWGKQQFHSKQTYERGGLCSSADEKCWEGIRASTTSQGQNFHFLKEASGRMALQADKKIAVKIKHSDMALDLDSSYNKGSPNSRLRRISQFPECSTDCKMDGKSGAQQAWIQRWSSSMNSGAGPVKSLRHATENSNKSSPDLPEKFLANSSLNAMFAMTPTHKEKSYVGCIDQSSRDHSKEGNRNRDGAVARVDGGFKYILGSCLPTRSPTFVQGKYGAPKAQAMAIVGAVTQMHTSPVQRRGFFPIIDATVEDFKTKGIPQDISCNSGGNVDVDMDILNFLAS